MDIRPNQIIIDPVVSQTKSDIYRLARKKMRKLIGREDFRMDALIKSPQGTYKDGDLNIFKNGATYGTRTYKPNSDLIDVDNVFTISKVRVYMTAFFAFIRICIFTSTFSEYILPFVLALVAASEIAAVMNLIKIGLAGLFFGLFL